MRRTRATSSLTQPETGGLVVNKRAKAKDDFSSVFVHYWNFMRSLHKAVISVNVDHPLYGLFKENCPLTEENLLRRVAGSSY